jgi:hypothetical protein
MENALALETMHAGHDGSGMCLILMNLGGESAELKDYPRTLRYLFERRATPTGLAYVKGGLPVKA